MHLLRHLLQYLILAVVLLMPGLAVALGPTQLGVIVNTRDPLSVAVAEYYVERRGIPPENVIRVSFTPITNNLTRARFDLIKAQVDEQAGPQIEAYAITWTSPYRVDCMSITSAFAFGFDPEFCTEGCNPTKRSAYFNSSATFPHGSLAIRPAMSIAAGSFEQAKALIDRGVASDGTKPAGTAYLAVTSGARNVRSALYPLVEKVVGKRLPVRRIEGPLTDANDVLFYFIGLAQVDGLDTLQFPPGAIADHLTSFGGNLLGNGQMSVLRWLEAGATGSYGTVVEPCNLLEKFPHPAVVMSRYLRGETLIEAYWKSVLMPGQGIFVGEPLAAPFRAVRKQP